MVDVPSPFKPWALCAVIAAAGTITTLIERGNYLDARAEVSAEKAARDRDVADAERAVREAMSKDAERSAEIISSLRQDTRSLEERLDAAQIEQAKVPIFVTPRGCPDVMSSPAVRAFLRGLPDELSGQAGPRRPRRSPGVEGALPSKTPASLGLPKRE